MDLESGRCRHQLQEHLAATLAHELRTPLASILTDLHLMRDDLDEATARQTRERTERQARHMARIIDDVLDICRCQGGKLCLRKERVDLGAVIDRALESAGPRLATRRHYLTVSMPQEPVWLLADESRLIQILTNLLTNAARYTEPGGDIRLLVEATDGVLVVRVRDNGIGIAPGELPHIFEMLRQGERPGIRGPGGLGIGLAVVKSLVELHGGTIEALSEGPGTGSEFVIRLPNDA